VVRREEGVRQGLVLGAGRSESETGDDPGRADRQQQVEPFEPPQAVAPADVGQAGQPSPPPALGIVGGCRRAVQGFEEVGGFAQNLSQAAETGGDVVLGQVDQPVELAPVGQAGKSPAQVPLRVAVEAAFAPKAFPLARDGQSVSHYALSLRRSLRRTTALAGRFSAFGALAVPVTRVRRWRGGLPDDSTAFRDALQAAYGRRYRVHPPAARPALGLPGGSSDSLALASLHVLRQGHHLASRQPRRCAPRSFRCPPAFAEVLDEDVQGCQEGLEIDHRRAPNPDGTQSLPSHRTLRPGVGFRQINSHQTL